MHENDEDPFDKYAVVVNDEEQYSIWPTEKTIPSGWRTVGQEGTKKQCLDYVEQVWTDMRPLSLRKKMEEWAKNPPPPAPSSDPDSPGPSLIDRLCEGEHPVIFNCRPERTAQALNQRISMGYVHLKFTKTQGGTELGVRLDPDASDWSGADFEQGIGHVRLVGGLTLDYVKVQCIANIDVKTLEGTGHLKRVQEGSTVSH